LHTEKKKTSSWRGLLPIIYKWVSPRRFLFHLADQRSPPAISCRYVWFWLTHQWRMAFQEQMLPLGATACLMIRNKPGPQALAPRPHDKAILKQVKKGSDRALIRGIL